MKPTSKKTRTFTDEEKAAMKERVAELSGKADGEGAVLEKISLMHEPDRSMAKRIHEIIKKNVPELTPKTWYGMPAYANAGGQIICFFQNAGKFKARYSTFGFSDKAKLDEGAMWATGFAISKLTATEEAKIIALVKKAVGK